GREAALEGEVVQELRDVIGGVQSWCLRVLHHHTITTAIRTRPIQRSTRLTRSNAARMASQFRPATVPAMTSRPYHRAEAHASGGSARAGRTRLIPAKTGTIARTPGMNRLKNMATVPQRA